MKPSRQRIKARRAQDLAVLLVAAVLLTHYAATKPTNQLENVGASLLRGVVVGTMPPEDVERGFAPSLSRTNEMFSFSMPADAVEERRWRIRGASDDDACVSSGSWSFPVGANSASAFRVHASGRVDAHPSAVTMAPPLASFMPLAVPLGIVPESNWPRLPVPGMESRFWHLFTPSNTLQFTWENVLFLRDAANPVSIQAELFDDGRFVYRYDISRCGTASLPGALTNAVVGAAFHGDSWTTNAIPANVTSTTFYPLHPPDLDDPDPDGDGISTVDEIRLHGTDPHLADTDLDGLSDYDELFVHGTDPFDPRSLGGPGSDGLAARLAGFGPYDFPEGSTNTAYEHVFYSGSPAGAIEFPQPTDNLAVLRVLVSGSGSGDLVVGDRSYPLLPPPQLRSGAGTNTLFIAVGRGVVNRLWWRRPEGLDVALKSDDFMVGSLPSLRAGWIAFPYTDANTPCIHDLRTRSVAVSISHAFPDLVATWESGGADVEVKGLSSLSARITGRFDRSGTRQVSYTVSHTDYLAGKTNFTQQVRFCPRNSDGVGEPPDVTEGESHYVPCNCDESLSGICRCGCDIYGHEGNMMCDCANCVYANPPEMTNDEEAEAGDEYDAAMSGELPPLEGVLHLYGDNSDAIHLDVPVGAFTNCCPCWDHTRSNYVAASYCSTRLNVIDASNDVFHISYSPCDVTVHGMEPSRDFQGDPVYFSTNGVLNREAKYTILGLKIDTPDDRPPIEVYNSLSRSLGYPVTVCTDEYAAASMVLRNDLLLPGGFVRVAVDNATGDVRICFAGSERYGHDAEPVLDTSVSSERFFPVRHWYRLVRRHDWDLTNVRVLVMASEPGPFDLVFEYAATNGNQVVHDVARQRVTAVRPPLMADYNGDGAIDAVDLAMFLRGRIFRFWTNKEKVKGRYVGDGAFSTLTLNAANDTVDGDYDLINFFPLALDLAQFPQSWRSGLSFKLAAPGWSDAPFNCCLSPVSWAAAGGIYTNDVQTVSGETLSAAHVVPVGSGGVALPMGTIGGFADGHGLVVAEAKHEYATLALSVIDSDGRELYGFTLPSAIVDVERMYRWANLRWVCGDSSGEESRLWSTYYNPDPETDGRHFVFVHGYNVNAESARVWANQIFKRLWIAGSRSMFTAVDWYGDSSQYYSLIYMDTVSPDYYANVMHAFATAPNLVDTVAALPGTNKVMLAHSLGNMLVSSAAVDHKLKYDRYYMLNAAVPMEAYDADSSTSNMVDSAWADVPDNYRASGWSGLFDDTNDFRQSLSWQGRFAGITNAVNCYSPTEDVLENATENGYGDAWARQELLKGTAVWHGINAVLPWNWNERVSCEGGWGINTYYAADPTCYLPLVGFYASVSNLTREAVIEHPLFTPFRAETDSMHSTNLFYIADADYRAMLRAKFLGDAIPATSFAAGANEISGNAVYGNICYADCMSGTWPIGEGKWRHSDIKNVAYFFNWKIFKRIINNDRGGTNASQQ